MSTKKSLIVPTALVAGLLTLAPLVAQETDTVTGGPARTTDTTVTDDDGPNLGWLGLLGLIGLAGLIRRDNHDHHRVDATRTNVNR